MNVIIRKLGQMDYIPVWEAMHEFTDQRNNVTKDEIWLLQHPPIFTQGQAGKEEHLLNPRTITVVKSDRGGQITYHGPGQLICYVLLNLRRLNLTIKKLVYILEQSVIDLLKGYEIKSERRDNAPGIYVDQAKIAALGLRVRKGCTFHGLALNVSMNLEPFSRINPCGFSGMQVTQISDHNIDRSISEVSDDLIKTLCSQLNYNLENIIWKNSLPLTKKYYN